MNIETALNNGLKDLNLTLSSGQQQKLIDYVELLHKWNKTYNLTAIREPSQMITKHILDSLAINPYLQGDRIIDVGTGAGLPGIPLAINNPDKQFTLLDSNGKKTTFLTQAKAILALENVVVVKHRAESFHPEQCFDTVLSRAFTSVQNMLKMTAHLCCPDGRFLAMKGRYPAQELAELPEGFEVQQAPRVDVPGLFEARHLVIATRVHT